MFKGIHVASIMGNKGSFEKTFRQRVSDYELLYHFAYFVVCVFGLSHCFFYSVLLFDVVYREETLLNVIKSVTKNGRSILLTAVLALILVYLFSIIGFIFFQDDFVVPVSLSVRTGERPTAPPRGTRGHGGERDASPSRSAPWEGEGVKWQAPRRLDGEFREHMYLGVNCNGIRASEYAVLFSDGVLITALGE